MDRRTFLAGASAVGAGVTAGCLTGGRSDPPSRIDVVELENHRLDAGYDFTVRIEADDELLYGQTHHLGASGSGDGAVAIEQPVSDPGAYSVSVAVADESVTVETENLVSDDEDCLYLQFYLGARTLHREHRSYQQCD